MGDCPRAEVRDQLPDLVNGTMDPAARAAVERHVAECAVCAAELAMLRRAHVAMARTPAIDIARVASAVRAATRQGQTRSAPRRQSWLVRHSWPVAAAAGVLVAVTGVMLATHGERVAGRAPTALVQPESAAATSGLAVAPGPSATDTHTGPVGTIKAHSVRVPHTGTAAGPSLAVEGGLSDLSDDDLHALLRAVDAVQALPDEEPATPLDMGGGEGTL